MAVDKEAESQLRKVMAEPCNRVCADCGAPKPRFASITLAVFLCNRCFAIHRSVGAHITRTKCVGLDRWSLEEVHRMRSIGNSGASSYWECNVPEERLRPSVESPDALVEQWIRDKYEKKLFCPRDTAPPMVPQLPKHGATTSFQLEESSWKPFG